MELTVRRHRPPAKWLAAATATLILLSMLPFASGVAAAPPSLLPATGGEAISADTGVVGGTYTTLSGPYIVGTTSDPIGVGPVIIQIPAPQHFSFDQAASVSAGLSGGGCGTLTIAQVVINSASQITVTTGVGPSTGACTLSVSGIGVRPTAGTFIGSQNIAVSGLGVSGNGGTLTEVAGAAAKLVFSQEPGAGTAGTGGVAWVAGKQPWVEVRDQFDNVRTQDNSTSVALNIGNNPPGTGVLSCATRPLQVTAGVAKFTGCKIDKSGTGYTLVASIAGPITKTSTAFDITTGPAAQLGFTQQPVGNVQYGIVLSTQPWVAVQDAGGNTVTAASDAITISLLVPTLGGPGSLATCTASTSSGVAKFTTCRVNTNSGLGYKLHAASTGLAAADSAAFNIFSGTPTKLVFSTQPGGGTGGTIWAQPPVVQVQDVNSQIAIQDVSTPVTLAIGTNPSSGALACTTNPLTVANGVAAFAGCKIDKTGTAYTLTASSTGLASATSSAFNITAGTAVKLGFTGQPGASTSNLAFATQPVVAIQDAGGNTITTAPATTVTLAIGTNPAAGTLTCTSGLTRTTVNGVATFSGCAINNAGVGYTLTATASGYTAATSTAFTVSAPTAGITISASPTAVNRTQSTVLTIQFAAYGASRSVVLQRKTALDSDWVSVGVLTTDSLGRATVSVTPSSSTQYRASFLGTADLLAAVSAPITVGVRYTGNLGPRTSSGSSTLARGTRKTYTGTMRPIVAGQRMSFMIYKWNGSAWVFQTSATISANASGQATFSWTWSRSGRWYIRIRLNADRMYATAWTNLERVTIP